MAFGQERLNNLHFSDLLKYILLQFLSMKLAAVDPLIDFNMQSLIENEVTNYVFFHYLTTLEGKKK